MLKKLFRKPYLGERLNIVLASMLNAEEGERRYSFQRQSSKFSGSITSIL